MIIEGNNLQLENKQFVYELTSWFRYSKSEAEKTKNGIWTSAMGLPNMRKLIGNFVMKNFVSAKSEAKRLNDTLQHTQDLAIFVNDENKVTYWVNIKRYQSYNYNKNIFLFAVAFFIFVYLVVSE